MSLTPSQSFAVARHLQTISPAEMADYYERLNDGESPLEIFPQLDTEVAKFNHFHDKAGRFASGISLSDSDMTMIGSSLSTRQIRQAYTEGYNDGQALKEVGIDLQPSIKNRTDALNKVLTELRVEKYARTLEAESMSAVALDHYGFIHGASGDPRAIRPPLFNGDIVGGLTLSGVMMGKSESSQPVLKFNPNHDSLGRFSTGDTPGIKADKPARSGLDEAAVAAATALREKYAQIEPVATKAISTIAAFTGGKLESLDNRLKSTDSLAAKIAMDAAIAKIPVEKAANEISDVVRYTMVFPNQAYTEGVQRVTSMMQNSGFSLNVKNFWQQGDPYQGINIKANRGNATIELQLHTPESLHVKQVLIHPIYEAFRSTSDIREAWHGWSSMIRLTAKNVPTPPGYDRLLNMGTLVMQQFTTPASRGLTKSVDSVSKSVGKYEVSSSDEPKRYTLGAMYIPDRLDAHGEHTDSEELQTAVWQYVRSNDRRIRLQHHKEIIAGEWVEVMSFPYEITVPVQMPDGSQQTRTYPAGTVFLGVVWEPWAWQLVLDGKILGYSIGGKAERLYVDLDKPTEVDKIGVKGE